ncbi:hypothetical protein LWI29_035033 [Acer saccharum]|uniref:Uncharacterized protein n=1 Tax=Acer saccharum TaxID=4024 RepID=A0AA39T5M9_ACESA|nr:hypothetical protein LWI29_035033 [Acer saccharum]KAK1582230.1 hypothetical protein Q3G72_013056 [Acer saccharum]
MPENIIVSCFKPLVGIVKDDSIDCKNGGVLFLEAQVNCNLSEILQNPNPDKFVNKYLPDDVNNSVLAIQLNLFKCGGIAIGVRISHRVADGSSIFTFIENWADTARNGGKYVEDFQFFKSLNIQQSESLSSAPTDI